MAQDAKVTTVPTLMAQDAKVTTIPASRSPAAERMRQHRERRRQGLRCLLIEISETEIEGLIRKGLLPAEMRNDVGAVMSALYEHLDRTLACARDAQRAQRSTNADWSLSNPALRVTA